MTRELIRHNRPVSDHLHPLVYKAAVGLALWFVLAAWLLFRGGDYLELLLIMVSVLMLIAVAIPTVIWLSWRKAQGPAANKNAGEDFGEWLSGDFETWQGRVSAREAAIQVLLPLAAVAFGLTAIGIVLHFTAT